MLRTMQTRTVVLIGSLSLAAGWLVGTSSVSQEPQAPAGGSAAARGGPRPLGSENYDPPAPHTQQLKLRMKDVPRSPTPGRNPFAFSARPMPMAAPRTNLSTDAPAAIDTPPPPVMPRPRFELSGIASSERDGKATLTAILMDNGSLIFATVGDKLAGGYEVVRISDTTIVISNPLGAEQTVTLGRARQP
jgi:hypothetical protein